MKLQHLLFTCSLGICLVSCHKQSILETSEPLIAPDSSIPQTTSETVIAPDSSIQERHRTVGIPEVPDAIIESDNSCALQFNLSKLFSSGGVLTIPAQIKKKGHIYNVTAIGHPDMVEFEGYMGFEEVMEYMEQHPDDYTGEDPDGITTVNLPSTISHLGVIIFHCYNNLTTINCHAKTPPTAAYPEFPENVTIHVPNGCAKAYRAAQSWQDCKIVDDL